MKNYSLLVASAVACSSLSAQIVIQEWNFTEDGSGLANRVSEQGLNAQFFDDPDPVAFDGGVTVQTASGFSGDRPLGISLSKANATSITISATIASFDFETAQDGATDYKFGIRLRDDATNTTFADLQFAEQDANDRVRLLGQATAGVAINDDISASPITYGITLDLVNDTYTYWIGTPTSGAETWESRFAAYTGALDISTIAGGVIDAVQWSGQGDAGADQFVIDQVQVSYVAIPEPSSYALIFAGAVAVFVVWRRKKQ